MSVNPQIYGQPGQVQMHPVQTGYVAHVANQDSTMYSNGQQFQYPGDQSVYMGGQVAQVTAVDPNVDPNNDPDIACCDNCIFNYVFCNCCCRSKCCCSLTKGYICTFLCTTVCLVMWILIGIILAVVIIASQNYWFSENYPTVTSGSPTSTFTITGQDYAINVNQELYAKSWWNFDMDLGTLYAETGMYDDNNDYAHMGIGGIPKILIKSRVGDTPTVSTLKFSLNADTANIPSSSVKQNIRNKMTQAKITSSSITMKLKTWIELELCAPLSLYCTKIKTDPTTSNVNVQL